MQKQHRGFTLIEILIVVAIIAILASVVLVGLGPTQQQGRDARRISDLREVQNALELYYNKYGTYPSDTSWATLVTDLTSSSTAIGVTQVPNDPTPSKTYYFESFTGGSSYVIGAVLESANSSVFTGYSPPSIGVPNGMTDCSKPNYCLSL